MYPAVAELGVCRELFELSGWDDTPWSYYWSELDDTVLNLSEPLKVTGGVGIYDKQYPAYDLGYLIRHLPLNMTIYRAGTFCEAAWHRANGFDEQRAQGETPEDAAVRLAIQMFKLGLMKRIEM